MSGVYDSKVGHSRLVVVDISEASSDGDTMTRHTISVCQMVQLLD
jgi:hypothetical protein